jgi:5-methylthioadenosine/S-adenosylhomocysteine deaminase
MSGPAPARGGLTVRGASIEGAEAALRCEGGVIAAVGPEVEPAPGDEVIDATGMTLVPGFVNGHTHAAMTLLRGYADDLPLMTWLEEHIWPIERRMEPEDVYWGTRLACLEMIRTGTTCFWDMYWHPDAAARAVEDAGLRAVTAAPLIDGADPEASAGACEGAAQSLERIGESAGELASPGFAAHAIYTVSEPSLRWVAERSTELGIPAQIHLSETEGEVERCVAEHGVRPAGLLDRVGLLGPRTVIAHGTWLDRGELELIADRGATVVTNPVANLKLAVGRVFPYAEAREAGVPVGIGTDGPGSNNSLDLLADAKAFALVQKHEAGDPTAVDAAEVLELARGRLSTLLGGRELGPGAPADFLLVRADDPALATGALDAGLVYAASGSIVDTTVVAGRPLMRGGSIEGTREIVARARERVRALGIDAP